MVLPQTTRGTQRGKWGRRGIGGLRIPPGPLRKFPPSPSIYQPTTDAESTRRPRRRFGDAHSGGSADILRSIYRLAAVIPNPTHLKNISTPAMKFLRLEPRPSAFLSALAMTSLVLRAQSAIPAAPAPTATGAPSARSLPFQQVETKLWALCRHCRGPEPPVIIAPAIASVRGRFPPGSLGCRRRHRTRFSLRSCKRKMAAMSPKLYRTTANLKRFSMVCPGRISTI